jgi:putative tryptophan/tyrosine transport system substrate-binding protein
MGSRVRIASFSMSIAVLALVATLVLAPAASSAPRQPLGGGATKVYKVALFEIVTLNIIDDLFNGFKKTMAKNGFTAKNVKYKVFNAQGQTTNCNTISQQLAQQKWDLVYVVGTSCVQALYQKHPRFPVLFGAMTDPIGSGMAKDFNHPNKNSTGTTDFVSPDQFLSILLKINPKVKTVGTIGNATEANSVSWINKLEAATAKLNLKIVKVPVQSTNDVQIAAQSLVGRVDAIIAPPDNTVEPAIGSVIKVATDNKLPLVAAKSEFAKNGALIGMGVDYFQIGQINGVQGAKILKGKKPETLPVQGLANPITFINLTTARSIGLVVPPSVLSTKNVHTTN